MIDITREGRSLVVDIGGDIDHHTADEIKTEIDNAFARTNAKDIVLNLENVTFMDSSGIGMIIGRYKNAQQQSGTLRVANISSEIRRIFELSGLLKIIQAFNSVENALNDGEGGK